MRIVFDIIWGDVRLVVKYCLGIIIGRREWIIVRIVGWVYKSMKFVEVIVRELR